MNPTALLDDLEEGIEALRVAFEKYFLGIERVAPIRQREQMQRKLREIEAMRLRSTVQRFRLGSLRARLVTYGQYWTRVLDQMERGTWRRDLARQATRERNVARAANSAPASDDPVRPSSEEAQAPIGAPAVVATASPGSHQRAGGAEEDARRVFSELMAAKRSLGEPVEGLTFQGFLRRLDREAPKLRQQYGDRPVRFSVEVREGKVRLRARPG